MPLRLAQPGCNSKASRARLPGMGATRHDKPGVPADSGLPHDEFHKAYFTKVVAVLELRVDFVKRILPSADEWIDFGRLEPLPTETVD